MTSGPSLRRNTFHVLLRLAIDAAGAIVVSLLIARLFGTANNGSYAFAVSIAALTVGLAGMGLPAFATRQIAQLGPLSEVEARATFGSRATTTYACFTVPLAACAALTIVIVARPASADPIVTAAVLLMTLQLGITGLFTALFHGTENFIPALLANATQRGAAIGAVFIVGLLTARFDLYLAVVIATQTAINISLYTALRSRGLLNRLIVPMRISDVLRLLRSAAPFATTVILEIVYFRGIAGFLGLFALPSVVGLFAAAHTLFVGMTLPAYAMGTALYPRFAKLGMTNPGDAKALFRRTFALVVLYGVLAGVGLYYVAPIAVPILLGQAYRGSIPVLRILSVGVPLAAVGRLCSFWLNASRTPIRATFTSGAGAGVALGVGLYLSKAAGAVGAAWATVWVEAAVATAAVAFIAAEFATTLHVVEGDIAP